MNRSNESSWAGSCLNSNNCLTLKQIVASFSAPITEEHAWAIVYETVKTLDICLGNPAIYSKLYSASNLDHVLVHQDGLVHQTTFIQESAVFSHDRVPITSENKVTPH